MREERISQRVHIELPAMFCFQESPNSWIGADVINISTHGFCFRTKAKYAGMLSDKPVIQLGFALSVEESVALDIQVVWAGKTSDYNCLVGGEILNPSGSDYKKILEFYTKTFRERSG